MAEWLTDGFTYGIIRTYWLAGVTAASPWQLYVSTSRNVDVHSLGIFGSHGVSLLCGRQPRQWRGHLSPGPALPGGHFRMPWSDHCYNRAICDGCNAGTNRGDLHGRNCIRAIGGYLPPGNYSKVIYCPMCIMQNPSAYGGQASLRLCWKDALEFPPM